MDGLMGQVAGAHPGPVSWPWDLWCPSHRPAPGCETCLVTALQGRGFQVPRGWAAVQRRGLGCSRSSCCCGHRSCGMGRSALARRVVNLKKKMKPTNCQELLICKLPVRLNLARPVLNALIFYTKLSWG